MSKRIRTLIVCGVAMVVLCGALAAVLLLPPESTPGEESSSAATTTTAAPLPALIDKAETGKTHTVASAKITVGARTFTVAPDADGLMTVTDYADLPRDTAALDTLCRALTTITPLSLVREQATAEELSACGFDKPQAAVTVTYLDNSTFAFEIGAIEYGGKVNSYFREAKGQTVYLVDASFVSAVTQPDTAYIGRTLVSAPTPREDDEKGKAQLMAMTLSGTLRTQTVTLRYATKEDEEQLSLHAPYTITAPYYRTSDEQITGSWQTGIGTLTASGVAAAHPTAEQLKQYGLQTPYSVAEMTFAVYSEQETYNTVTATVRLGGKTADGEYYAMLDGVDAVYTVAANAVPWAEYTYDTLVAQFLFLEYITDIHEVVLTVDGTENVIGLTHGKDENDKATLAAKLNGKESDAAVARSLYQTLMSIQRLAPADGEEPVGEPKLTLKLTSLEGETEAEIALYSHSANRYVCRQADGDTYLVKASDVETALTQIADYLASVA